MSTAIPKDAAKPMLTFGKEWSEDDAAEELLTKWADPTDAETPSETPKEPKKQAKPQAKDEDEAAAEKPEAEDEPEEEAEDNEADEETDDEGDEEKKFADEEGTFVKIKVGEEEHEVPVSKLTRLYGQEASLTKKSMEVAELRKTAEADLHKNTTATAALLERARERFKPFATIDFNLLAGQVGREGGLTAEEYQGLRASAQAAWEDMAFLEQHLDGFVKAVGEKKTAETRAKAQETLKTLAKDPSEGGIEGWSQKLYDDIRGFAVSYGIPAETVNNAVEPWAIRLMHDAMLYARGRDKSSVKVVKAAKAPKKIVKTTNSPVAEKSDDVGKQSTKAKKAMQKLSKSGHPDDAAEALLARWATSDDD
jgi:hypothetical protein